MNQYLSASLNNVVSIDFESSWIATRWYDSSNIKYYNARFQQKQMQEKEEKLLKLYENQQQRVFERVGRGSAGSNTSIGTTGGGKVRQMFDERRQKAGVDKSYPLEPLKSKTSSRGAGLDRNINVTNRTVVKSTVRKSVGQVKNGKPTGVVSQTIQKSYNSNYKNGLFEDHSHFEESCDNIDSHNLVDLMNNHNLNENLDNEEMPQIGFNENFEEKPVFGKLANLGGQLPSQMIKSKPVSNGISQRNGFNKQQTKALPKKPVAKATPPPITSSTTSSASSQSSRSSPARSVNSMSAKQASSSLRAPTNNRPSSKQAAKSPVVRDDLAGCRYCGRRFATDRLGTHEDICGKTGKKKRKTFDSTKHRVQGTELEVYVLKGGKKGASSKKVKETASSREIKAPAKNSSSKANWRKTHEEFIAAIRAAKQAQAYVAQGGKLSDLPPPPPSSNPDYVQCPHCGRRFNEAAAQRHIPKCASYDFNKPKPGSQKGRPGKH